MTEARNSEFDHPKNTTRSTEDGFSGSPTFGDEDGFSGLLPFSGIEDGLCSYGDKDDKDVILKDDKGGILEDGCSGLPSNGDEDAKGGILEDAKGGILEDDKGGILEDGLSGLCSHGAEGDKGVILEDGFCSYGAEDDKGGIFKDGLSGLPSFGDEGDKGGILEDGVAEKVKKKQRICETGRFRDPLVVLGSDVMLMILNCVDAPSVALSLLVSRGWHAIASCDKIWSSKEVETLNSRGFAFWSGLLPGACLVQLSLLCGLRAITQERVYPCEELWHGKAHLPRVAKFDRLSKLAAYSLSMMDGKRKRVRKEDLCDHVWEFHFTEAAPEYWRMLDPYWNGTGPPLRRYFLPDGSQTAEPHDKIWGGHESCYSIVTGLLADGKMRKHYVRINRWLPMYVTRNEDWSWEISNNLCIYRSIPDADKEDGTGPLFLLH
ncbi:hypothetical protein RND71_022523 [Anisodus tanguticus]|uniref:F-box domain-containing protein n=1 Tax=Anisodus tanguticus TaxID=243964 RepID=A0AAE1RTZ1_9SOLA|nr:hypothetical protein RND71_022523 [Anisodus tanguticus]